VNRTMFTIEGWVFKKINMYTLNNQQNADKVLLDLVDAIQNFSDSMHTYLHHIGEQVVLNPFQKIDFSSINEQPIPCELFERFGIRRSILNAFPGRLAISDHCHIEHDKKNISSHNWNNIKSDVSIEELKMFFRSCDIIQFADWASVYNASDFWDGLLSDVIRPLNKKNFQFIFYLGDPTKRFVFETDEILDIISEYSSCGKVTLVLDENGADRLWSILNGWNPGSTHFSYQSERAMEKYLSIFNTMSIDALVIFSVNRTVLLSREQRFEFAGRSLNHVNASKYVKDCFDAGYQLGLLLQLKVPHCIALGLAISGAYLENGSEPDQNELLQYIKEWMAELKTLTSTLKDEFQNTIWNENFF
jgi:hypothetical protein